MKFTKDALVNGTSLVGYVTASYDQLVAKFGAPDFGPDDRGGDKVTCEWDLEFEDGTVATIYDWKLYETPYDEYQWHIGGKSFQAVERVLDVMEA